MQVKEKVYIRDGLEMEKNYRVTVTVFTKYGNVSSSSNFSKPMSFKFLLHVFTRHFLCIGTSILDGSKESCYHYFILFILLALLILF